MPDTDLSRFLTPAQFADEFQMHRKTVYEKLRNGEIPGRKVGGRWKIPRWAVEEVGTPAHLAA